MVVDLPLREATPADVPTLVRHRRRMFEEMDAAGSEASDAAGLDAMDAQYAVQLGAHLRDGRQRAWVIESPDRIVASGVVLFCDWLPRPSDLTQRLAYLHSVFTEPAYRRRGLARRIVDEALAACRQLGLRRLSLHASDAGRPMYLSMGFLPTNEMRRVWSE